MTGTGRHLASTVCIVLGCPLVAHGIGSAQSASVGRTPVRVVAQTPVEGWSGQVQCVIASRGVGYQDDQTHTWVLTGAPVVRNDFRDYPATWTVSGTGRRTPISARAAAAGVGDSWTYGGSEASASITLFVPIATGTIRIAGGQRAVKATSGLNDGEIQRLVSGRHVARSHVRFDEVALPMHDVRLAELMAFGQSAGVLKRPDRLFHTTQAKL